MRRARAIPLCGPPLRRRDELAEGWLTEADIQTLQQVALEIHGDPYGYTWAEGLGWALTILGLGSALAGGAYIVLGRIQQAAGLEVGILIGFSMVVPAALIEWFRRNGWL